MQKADIGRWLYAEQFASHKPDRSLLQAKFGSYEIVGLFGLEGSGKSYIAQHLVDHGGYIRLSFAAPLRRMLEAIGVSAHYHTTAKTATLPHPFAGKTARRLLQTLGTEWGRKFISETIWADLLEIDIYNLMLAGHRKFIIDDARFAKGELELLSRIGRPIFVYNPDLRPVPDYIPRPWEFWKKLRYHPSREVAAAMHQQCRNAPQRAIAVQSITYEKTTCEVFPNSQEFSESLFRRNIQLTFSGVTYGRAEIKTPINAGYAARPESGEGCRPATSFWVPGGEAIPQAQNFPQPSPAVSDILAGEPSSSTPDSGYSCSSPGDAGSSSSSDSGSCTY